MDCISEFDFMYLNPRLKLASIEEACEYIHLNSNQTYVNLNLPNNFQPHVFLNYYRNILNISELNQVIKEAYFAEGRTSSEIEANSAYQSTIFKYVSNLSNDLYTFKFDRPIITGNSNYMLNESNLRVGDNIKIMKEDLSDVIYAKVQNVDYSCNQFTISNIFGFHPTRYSNHILYGIQIYDLNRLASIEYMRLSSNGTNPFIATNVPEETFNYELYKILYPEARSFSREEAYDNYVSHLSIEENRIIRADDFKINHALEGFCNINNRIVTTIPVTFCNDVTFDSNSRTYFSSIQTSNAIVRDLLTETTIQACGGMQIYRTSNIKRINNLISSNIDKACGCGNNNFLTGNLLADKLVVKCNATFCNNISCLETITTKKAIVNDLLAETTIQAQGGMRIYRSRQNNPTFLSNLSNLNIVLDTISVTGQSYFLGAFTVSNKLQIDGNITTFCDLIVGGSSTMNDLVVMNNLNVSGQAAFSNLFANNLAVCNITFLNSNPFDLNNITNTLNVASNVIVGGVLITSNADLSNTTLYGTTSITGNATTSSNLTILGDLNVSGQVTFSNNLMVYGTLTTDKLTVCNITYANTTINGFLSNTGDTQLNGTVNISGPLNASCNLIVGGILTSSNAALSNTMLYGPTLIRGGFIISR